MTASALASEVGIAQPTLSSWLRQAATVPAVVKQPNSRPPESWTPAEKLDAVIEAAGLSEEELGAWLRERGLHEEHLKAWREQAKAGFTATKAASPSGDRKRLKELERQLAKTEKKLKIAESVITLQKKIQSLLEDGDGDTDEKKGKE